MAFDPQMLLKKYGKRLLPAVEAEMCERDLATFLQRSWSSFDASRFMRSWLSDAMADHLMAVVDGEIRKLLITVPPRCSKTSLAAIAFPAWVWALKTNAKYPLHGPTAQFLCIAYNTIRAKEDAVTSRRLIGSQWYQDRWGSRVVIAADRDNAERFDTNVGGSRISTGIDATVLGRGGNIKIIDDAMKPDEPESEIVRASVMRAYDEVLSSRENDPRIAAEIVIAQRLAEFDLPGHVLTKYGTDASNGGFVHLMVPCEYDWQRHCSTVIGWQDPRGCKENDNGELEMLPAHLRKLRDGASFWPERFTPAVIQQRKTAEGPYSFNAKYQQAPVPRGGGIIKSTWWQLWRGDFPSFDFVLVSCDTAHTKEDQNDESGITVWGIWKDPDDKNMPKLMLINAWEGRLEFNNLVEKIADYCRGRYEHGVIGPQTDVCLIEGKANGIDVINEIRRRFGKREWSTIQFDPTGDKVARLTSVQAIFSGEFKADPTTGESDWVGGIVYAPDRDYAQLTIDRVAAFTGGRMKSVALVDVTSQALQWLRRNSYILTTEEHQDDLDEEMEFKPQRKAMFDV